MKQVVQVLKSGEISVEDVPVPALQDRYVLVETLHSVISAGTEKTKVDMGKSSLLGKARARPDLVKQVLRKLRSDGFKKTFQTVNARLSAANPLGYSSAGRVIAVGGQVAGIRPGDLVACAGAGYANHAEVVAVPRNLVVPLPDGVGTEEAAFATLGSIALQGVRLCEPRLGETIFVLGLGLLGQIAVQLLRANGCRVIGTDLDPDLCRRAEVAGAMTVAAGDGMVQATQALTAGRGVDAVVICAGSSSNQPIELAAEICRQQGRVVVVGAVSMDIPREPYFKKEISVVISRSYGPGRYDPAYEEGGVDYPIGYVRFTEQRNMETILDLMKDKTLDVGSLVTHRFPFDDATAAYALIEGARREPYLGIVLGYSGSVADRSKLPSAFNAPPVTEGRLPISFCGAGNYATATLIPALVTRKDVQLLGVMTSSGRSAASVAKQFAFGASVQSFGELVAAGTKAVVIATRHDDHAPRVLEAIRAGIHAYVEKPLALTLLELDQIEEALAEQKGQVQLMVGFNRRFAPLVDNLRKHFADSRSPLVVAIRVNAGALPAEHWLHDPAVGGGRLIGEGCHFVDLASAICGGLPVEVSTIAAADASKGPANSDNLCISIKFNNGSVASVVYTGSGSPGLEKEFVEVFGAGRSACLRDFKHLDLYFADGAHKTVRLPSQDKGQRAMLAAWVEGLRSGKPPVPTATLLACSRATILAAESLGVGMPLPVRE